MLTNFNAIFTVRFRKEQHMRWYEFHPPHLINVATLPGRYVIMDV